MKCRDEAPRAAQPSRSGVRAVMMLRLMVRNSTGIAISQSMRTARAEVNSNRARHA